MLEEINVEAYCMIRKTDIVLYAGAEYTKMPTAIASWCDNAIIILEKNKTDLDSVEVDFHKHINGKPIASACAGITNKQTNAKLFLGFPPKEEQKKKQTVRIDDITDIYHVDVLFFDLFDVKELTKCIDGSQKTIEKYRPVVLIHIRYDKKINTLLEKFCKKNRYHAISSEYKNPEFFILRPL